MRGKGNGEGAAVGSAKIPDSELGGGTLDKVTLPSLDVSFSFFFPRGLTINTQGILEPCCGETLVRKYV